MSSTPFFSVVIPLYNKEKDIARTLQSVIDQDYQNFEIIIVNDGSTDDSEDIVKDFLNDKVKYFYIKNSGPSTARNYGVDKAKYEYIAFLDADDIWYDFHLKTLSQLITRFPSGSWYATGYEFVLEEGKKRTVNASVFNGNNTIKDGFCNYFTYSLADSIVSSTSVCLKKSLFYKLGGFDVEIETGQDIDMWVRAAIHTELCFTIKITAGYYLPASNRITNVPTTQKRHMDLEKFVDEELTNDPLKRFMAFYRYWHIIKFRLAGDMDLANQCLQNLDFSLLTFKQRVLIYLPPILLKGMDQFKRYLHYLNINIRITR